MKRTVLIFIISALVTITVIIWAVNAGIPGSFRETLMFGSILIVVGFAFFIGIRRARSHLRKEPAEDELSRKVMVKASSLSYYISIYLWLIIMYFSDKSALETHTLIGAGIIGMAVIFFLSWLGVKLYGLKRE